MTPAVLIDLLREARKLIHTTLDINALREWACESDGDELALDDLMYSLRGRIDAALAESRDSATDVVESKVWWWQDKVIRAIVDGNAVTIQTNAPNHWFWSVAFVTRKDQYGLCERRDGISTTEAEAKEAALKAARGMR
jgi:hypothetical protein